MKYDMKIDYNAAIIEYDDKHLIMIQTKDHYVFEVFFGKVVDLNKIGTITDPSSDEELNQGIETLVNQHLMMNIAIK